MTNTKFSIEQIHEALGKVKTGEDFPQLVQDLKSIGVTHYDNFVANGITNYYGADNFVLNGVAKYPSLNIADTASTDMLKMSLSIHQQGGTDYPTFCRDVAEAGVEKWIAHMIDMTVTYFDRHGNCMVVERIPLA